MWIESIVQVGEESIGVRVQRLNSVNARARAAISIAWLTISQHGLADHKPTVWRDCLEDVLGPYVKLTVAEDRMSDMNSTWWSEVVSRALLQLVRENELMPDVRRQISHMERLHLLPHIES